MPSSTDRSRRTERILRDRDGRPVSEPADAVTGEIVEYDADDRPRRTRFFLQREELPWLPLSEPAFLLWVLVALTMVWVAVGFVLTLS